MPPNQRVTTATTSLTPAAAEHLEHRRARGARRLAVVAGALDVAVRAEHERRAVVPGVPVLAAEPLDDGAGGVLVGDPLDAAQEPGALTSVSAVAVAGDASAYDVTHSLRRPRPSRSAR